jgi:hypothetical protein
MLWQRSLQAMKCDSCNQFVPSTALASTKLVLCEGPSDAAFFRAFLAARGMEAVDVRSPKGLEPRGANGNSGFGKALQTIRLDRKFEALTHIVIVADKDLDANACFASVRTQVTFANASAATGAQHYPLPVAAQLPAGDPLKVSICLLPLAAAVGGLEDELYLCARTVRPDHTAAVEALAVACGVNNWPAQKQAKMKLRSLFSCTHVKLPEIALSQLWQNGMQAEYLVPLDHAALDPVEVVLRQLLEE